MNSEDVRDRIIYALEENKIRQAALSPLYSPCWESISVAIRLVSNVAARAGAHTIEFSSFPPSTGTLGMKSKDVQCQIAESIRGPVVGRSLGSGFTITLSMPELFGVRREIHDCVERVVAAGIKSGSSAEVFRVL